ncbi:MULTISPECIES: YfgM family protein [Halomonadaceae]|uniref:Ancillary SecYEG translocon subunit n=1 Tax=Vreelandella janggokensis TaxID=370767 RepID=A0ABT4IR45_9GAMM|nr:MULTISPECIES: tetratricopeptide repeat protein [Halomonas]MCZ0926147.1 tetratricopeptide repeat protein [Halomonas janggokensis]MCZ0931214.1 tetratricopeptide repeat protein [Halomonas janggokensis]MDR5886663.1 tetratricopeptide repeat protein [Halomonas janggokensis]
MADRSEDEQLDVIKRWWKENGTSLIAGAALAAAGVFGWNAWQDYQADKAEAASVRYQQLVSLAAGNELEGDQLSEAREMVDEIVSEHDDTLYAELALLLDARLAVQQDDLDSAVESLTQVAESSSRRYVQSLAWLRLARLAIANDDPERALELLDEPITDPLAAQQANVRGDAHMALGQNDQARNAWQDALSLAQQQGQPLYGVQFKLDDLGAEETTQ